MSKECTESTVEKEVKRFVWMRKGADPAFRWTFDPREGMTVTCPACSEIIAAGLEICPKCGVAIPGQQRSRSRLYTSPLTITLIAVFALVCCFGLYCYVRYLINSGAMALLFGK